MNNYKLDIKFSDFRTQIMTVKELVEIWQKQNLQKASLLSRMPSKEQCSRYVESLLVGMPLPPIYVDNSDGNWTIIEGADHIKAYADFCDNLFPLSSLYFTMNKYEGKYYDDMSNLSKHNINNAKIQVNVLNPGLTRQERFGIYTCLKSRLDADTLSSCRKHLYKESYLLIEEISRLVRTISKTDVRKTAYLENEVCHLLVTSLYKDYLQQGAAFNLDAVANGLLETDKLGDFIETIKDKIVSTLVLTRNSRCIRYGVRVQDFYNAAVFHSPENRFTDEHFLEVYRKTSVRGESRDNIVDFSNRLQQILIILHKES